MTPDQCDSCAFAPKGTGGAADEPKNRLVGLICAHGAIPFWCHHGKDGIEYDRGDPLGPMSLPAHKRKLCGGWKAMVAKLAKRGKFFVGETPEDRKILLRYQKGLASEAIRAVDTMIAAKGEAKRVANAKLRDLCRAVFDLSE